jgi:hypothetical protein
VRQTKAECAAKNAGRQGGRSYALVIVNNLRATALVDVIEKPPDIRVYT